MISKVTFSIFVACNGLVMLNVNHIRKLTNCTVNSQGKAAIQMCHHTVKYDIDNLGLEPDYDGRLSNWICNGVDFFKILLLMVGYPSLYM